MDGPAIRSNILLLATDAAAATIARSLGPLQSLGRPVLVVDRPAEAMREFIRTQPRWVIVCIASQSPDVAVSLLVLLHRRRAAVVALLDRHAAAVERTVRGAGITCYLALDSPGDIAALERLLDVAGVPPPRLPRQRVDIH